MFILSTLYILVKVKRVKCNVDEKNMILAILCFSLFGRVKSTIKGEHNSDLNKKAFQ